MKQRDHVLAIVVLTFGTTFILGLPVSAQTPNPCDTPNNLPPSFFEIPKGPQGRWSAFVSPDLFQGDDPAVPVVVVGAGAIQGPAHRRGMRLGCGVLRNRSFQPVTAIQLRWVLVRNQDRALIAQEGFTPKTVLVEGHTHYIDLSIPGESLRRTDFSVISFADATRALQKEDLLEGDYILYVGLNEVRFADESVWKAAPLSK